MKCAAHTPYFWSHQYRSLRLLGTGLDYRWREYFYSILTIRLFAPQAPRRAWSSSTSAFIQITCLWTTKLDHHTINSSCIIIASSSSHCLLPPFLSKLLDRSFSLQPPLLFCTTAFIATHVDDKELDTTHVVEFCLEVDLARRWIKRVIMWLYPKGERRLQRWHALAHRRNQEPTFSDILRRSNIFAGSRRYIKHEYNRYDSIKSPRSFAPILW